MGIPYNRVVPAFSIALEVTDTLVSSSFFLEGYLSRTKTDRKRHECGCDGCNGKRMHVADIRSKGVGQQVHPWSPGRAPAGEGVE